MNNKLFKRTAALLTGILISGNAILQTAAAEADSEKTPHELAEEMTAAMPLRQKLTQMMMLDIRQWNDSESFSNFTEMNEQVEELLKKYSFAGICLFGENLTGTEQTVRLTSQLQAAAAESQFAIPLLLAADQEGGSVVRLATGTDTCGNMALGAAGDPELAKKNAQIMGRELAASGINTDLAPVMDVNNAPQNPVINIRSFSSDPAVTAEMGAAFIEGLSQSSVISTAKHFPGHGNTDTDSHTGLPLVESSYDELKNCELIPFQAAIDAGVDMIMSAHIQFPHIESLTYTSVSTEEEIFLPATLSKTILTDILRSDMGFEGVIITDDMQMAALKENFAPCDTAALAINAGADILLDPVELTSQEGIEALETYLDQAEEAVSQGVIPESRIDQACTRVIELKLKKGLFGQDLTDVEARAEAAMEVIGSPEHHQLEMEITKQSVTLLKNSRHVLPLSLESGETAAFFYPWRDTENSLRYAFDGLVEEGIIPEGAKALYNSMDGHSAEEFADLVSQSKAVIISAETWGESDMDPAQNQRSRFIDEMIELAHSKGKKAVVMSMVLPYDTARYSAADAVLAGYNYKRMAAPAEGEAPTYGPNYLAAVCTVFGGSSPVGRLPVEVYGLDNSYRYTDQVLYPLGSGLLYPDGKLGDFDRDGNVDAADASGILSAYASLLTGDTQALTRQELADGDLDGDGLLDASDASLALRYYSFTQTGGELSFEGFLEEEYASAQPPIPTEGAKENDT